LETEDKGSFLRDDRCFQQHCCGVTEKHVSGNSSLVTKLCKKLTMVSRRKILSRSRDDLNMDDDYKDYTDHHQDDTWYSKEKLYKVLYEYSDIKMFITILGSCRRSVAEMGCN